MTWDELLSPKRLLFDAHPAEVDAIRRGEPVPFISTYGGGLNSTAGLVLMWKIGMRPDAILFADTVAEKPETYAHVELISHWCESVGFPVITTVCRTVDHDKQKHKEKYDTLEEECRVKKCLPSIAYFHRSCSQKWKHEPQDKWGRHWPPAIERWASGGKVLKAIYYDAGEQHRVKIHASNGYQFWYPLLDYDWGREDCVAAVKLAGLPVPPKSSCFFCPEMTIPEILALPEDLKARALAMEANADLKSIKGLGKHEYSWREVIDNGGRIPLGVVSRPRIPCGCFDGGEPGDGSPGLFDEA